MALATSDLTADTVDTGQSKASGAASFGAPRTFLGEVTALTVLALPLIGAQLSQISMNAVDTVMAGWLGPRDLAAVAIGGNIWIPVYVIGIGIILAVTPSVAQLYGLAFTPIAPEDYDFLLVEKRRDRPAVRAFLEALRGDAVRQKIRALGMRPADTDFA